MLTIPVFCAVVKFKNKQTKDGSNPTLYRCNDTVRGSTEGKFKPRSQNAFLQASFQDTFMPCSCFLASFHRPLSSTRTKTMKAVFWGWASTWWKGRIYNQVPSSLVVGRSRFFFFPWTVRIKLIRDERKFWKKAGENMRTFDDAFK